MRFPGEDVGAPADVLEALFARLDGRLAAKDHRQHFAVAAVGAVDLPIAQLDELKIEQRTGIGFQLVDAGSVSKVVK